MAVLWSGEFREDWRYAFAVGRVRVLQTRMLEMGRLTDLANSLNAEEMVGFSLSSPLTSVHLTASASTACPSTVTTPETG